MRRGEAESGNRAMSSVYAEIWRFDRDDHVERHVANVRRPHSGRANTGNAPLPVVFDFHPLGGTGQSQEQASGWGTKCDSVGCIAVFPNSLPSDDSWNVGYCCSDAQQQQVDDVQFTRDMLKWLEANTCVDPKHIYASGCSNGGGMSYMLACKAADVIAAVAPVDFRCVTGAQPASACRLPLPRTTRRARATCRARSPSPRSTKVRTTPSSRTTAARLPSPRTALARGSCSAFIFPSASVNNATWAHSQCVHRFADHGPEQRDMPSVHVMRRQYRGGSLHGEQCHSLRQLRIVQNRRHGLEQFPEGVAAVTHARQWTRSSPS